MSLTWHDPKTTRPALLEGVLLATPGELMASEGHRVQGNRYYFADGHEAVGVYAWALMPLCPPSKTTLKPLRLARTKGRA